MEVVKVLRDEGHLRRLIETYASENETTVPEAMWFLSQRQGGVTLVLELLGVETFISGNERAIVSNYFAERGYPLKDTTAKPRKARSSPSFT